MRNKYTQRCYVCGKMVEKGDGHIERSGRGTWQTRHINCESQHYLKVRSQNKLIIKCMALASKKQCDYIASLMEQNKSEYPTLKTIYNAMPRNNKKYSNKACDYRTVILAERLLPLQNYEANYIINWFLGRKNKYNKSYSTKQALKYLINLKIIK